MSSGFTTVVGDGVGDKDAVDIGVIEGVGEIEVVGIFAGATCFMGTPPSQTKVLPFLMQVNFLPWYVEVIPDLVHEAPAFGASADIAGKMEMESAEISATAIRFIGGHVREIGFSRKHYYQGMSGHARNGYRELFNSFIARPSSS